MMRIFGYVHKFVSKKKLPDLSSEDLRKGSHLLCRIIQRAHLYPEYRALRKGNCVESSSSIISLSPFIDDVGLIRVGGRLRHSTLSFDRVQDSPAFSVTGIDCCGPFYYKPDRRTRMPTKCYISIFICFATKAVWLELVKDFTTAGFLSALKRFVATRGIPRCIWSDNATNFVGARNELEDLRRLFMSEKHRDAVLNHCINNGFNWKFIPPRSPHFGGLWEAAVKMAEKHLYRSLGSSLFGFDELRTLVCQIQALMEFPEPDVTNLNFNRLWKRWSEEYLTLLQQRAKWRTPQPSIQVNDIVCIKDENLPPLKWPLARVIDVIA
ncbi:uncharacterized protein LOC121404396 [Drosophila obscura]|uniref:uncharacterized protein LOC121404396 n=1 Tax=Drosophila obscura TaxID=7282 RepID=UPI001BB0F2B1|nr:uncharacterized protein LOC121404396 [Drosophila obscura]